MEPWRVLESRALIERRWLTIREQRVALPHGAEIDEFHLVDAPSWVAVLPLTPNCEHVIMVEQYRHGVARASLELPAGVIDEGESAAEAAARELREETGHEAGRIEPLLTVSPDPARQTTMAHFHVALDVERVGEQQLDQSELIRVHRLTPGEVLDAIDDGRIVHGSHVGAILYAATRGWLEA